MSRVSSVWHRARSGAMRLALSCCAHDPASGRHTAQIVVTYKSTDQSVTYGSRTIRYDFYKSTLNASSPALGGFVERVTGVGSAC
jgi:hypothetical protein